MSQLTYPLFSVIGASSYQTVGNKIIIKDICSGDSTFIIAQARKKGPKPGTCSANNVIKDNMAAVRSTVTDQMTL